VIASTEERQPLERPLRDAIHREVVTLDEAAPIRAALELMVHQKVGSVIVTRGAASWRDLHAARRAPAWRCRPRRGEPLSAS